jgi:3-deoxy-manno-octulosonate cytidylyltransferase (CMP-KDO synthetase)
LFQFVNHRATELELTEKLEQLRALVHGLPVYVYVSPFDSIGVDTPGDLELVSKKLKAMGKK